LKTCWIDLSKPSPYKRRNSAGEILYRNVIYTQKLFGRELTRAEIAALVKKLREEKYIRPSKQTVWKVADGFLRKMKKEGVLLKERPEEEE